MSEDCSNKLCNPLESPLKQLLKPYQLRTEETIKQNLGLFGPSGKLREACEYALLSGGQRIRPAIVFMVAEALNLGSDVSAVAFGVECAHTASLIADDLPCMDNADLRRNKPSVHKVFGEAVALLSSYSLISVSNSSIVACVDALKTNPARISPHDIHILGILTLANSASNSGYFGTTGGQFMDIFPQDFSLSSLRDLMIKKTVSLFELAFVAGWLFGGGHCDLLPQVKKIAGHFGLSFQIADDIDDLEEDCKIGRKVNIASVFGKDKAAEMFHEEIEGYFESLQQINLASKKLMTLGQCFQEKVESLFYADL